MRHRLEFARLDFANVDSEGERFLAAQRWARARGLPRHVFVKSELEVKPMYLDFASPVSIRLAARAVKQAQEKGSGNASFGFSEMLPTLDEAWLPDAQDERYACELRFIAVDPAG